MLISEEGGKGEEAADLMSTCSTTTAGRRTQLSKDENAGSMPGAHPLLTLSSPLTAFSSHDTFNPPPAPIPSPEPLPEQADEQAGAPQTFGETLLCYLLPPLRHWLSASFLRPLLGSALLNFSLALGSSYLSVDSSRAGLQVLILLTLVALALTLKVPLKTKTAFAVLFALALTLLSFHRLGQVAKKTD